MKKNLVLGFIIFFLLNGAAIAGLSDPPKRESDKPPLNDPKENKLSDEEISRLSRRVETDNLYKSNLSNKEKNDSKNNLKPPPAQENNHTRFYVGAGVIVLIIILILVLV